MDVLSHTAVGAGTDDSSKRRRAACANVASKHVRGGEETQWKRRRFMWRKKETRRSLEATRNLINAELHVDSLEDTHNVLIAAVLSECVYKDDVEAAVQMAESFKKGFQGLAPLLHLQACSGTSKHKYLVGESKASVFVAFIGTNEVKDLWADVNVFKRQVFEDLVDSGEVAPKPTAHGGFLARARHTPIRQLYKAACQKRKKLVFCGHSLGAGVAALSMVRLLHAVMMEDGKLAGPPLCITFGGPAFASMGLARFVHINKWDALFRNYMLVEDIVPRMLGLRHHLQGSHGPLDESSGSPQIVSVEAQTSTPKQMFVLFGLQLVLRQDRFERLEATGADSSSQSNGSLTRVYLQAFRTRFEKHRMRSYRQSMVKLCFRHLTPEKISAVAPKPAVTTLAPIVPAPKIKVASARLPSSWSGVRADAKSSKKVLVPFKVHGEQLDFCNQVEIFRGQLRCSHVIKETRSGVLFGQLKLDLKAVSTLLAGAQRLRLVCADDFSSAEAPVDLQTKRVLVAGLPEHIGASLIRALCGPDLVEGDDAWHALSNGVVSYQLRSTDEQSSSGMRRLWSWGRDTARLVGSRVWTSRAMGRLGGVLDLSPTSCPTLPDAILVVVHSPAKSTWKTLPSCLQLGGTSTYIQAARWSSVPVLVAHVESATSSAAEPAASTPADRDKAVHVRLHRSAAKEGAQDSWDDEDVAHLRRRLHHHLDVPLPSKL